MEEYILEMKNITKKFPKVIANEDVTINLKKGEILALLGENGAGKSTLMNILYGLYKPTSGEINLDGEKVQFHSPKDAIKHNLGMVHQHFMLVENLTVTENIILGEEPGNAGFINYNLARKKVKELSKKFKLEIDPDEKIENLSVGLQQRVEILKALYRKAKILILDEPTAVLTPQEIEKLFEVIKDLVKTGVSVIIITHKLEEVLDIADRVYILRRGKLVGERNTKGVTKNELANMMVGRDVVLTVTRTPKKRGEKPTLKINNLVVYNSKKLKAVNNVSLEVYPGEIVGIAGVDGNGQTELAEAIIGFRDSYEGQIILDNYSLPINDKTQKNSLNSILNKLFFENNFVKGRLDRGISIVPADRQRHGLILEMQVAENLILGYQGKGKFWEHNILKWKNIYNFSDELIKKYDIRTPNSKNIASNLSGGNQQKVILAREFSKTPKFALIVQPTRGLDVGAIEYIHKRILEMRDANCAILLISLELEEIFSLSDRILVMYNGQITKEFKTEETDQMEVGFYMMGGDKTKVKEA
ncbi:MAG: ABC transporter ATP-binding protein [Spirochaetales bacterium]|nr:ABC transporter ATP-binding protein [Spirochaetales bacterium]